MKTTISTIAAIAAMNAAGFTIDAKTFQPISEGYAVAIAETQNSFGLQGIANVLSAINEGKANAIGGWYDEQTGLYYYDAVQVFDKWDDAYKAALANEQLAFFDLKECNEIRLKDSINICVA